MPDLRSEILKSDLFGVVEKHPHPDGEQAVAGVWVVHRSLRGARWWTWPLARWLAGREVRALRALEETDTAPRLLSWNGKVLVRTFVDGVPMQQADRLPRAYFRQARRLLFRMHRAGVAHNDLAKEPNWLVQPDGTPALIDFQLAWVARRRGCLLRLMRREDLRHLLKHKRTYQSEHLTDRERRILATPSLPARLWRKTGKRLYLLVTRGLFGWSDREGAGDRTHG